MSLRRVITGHDSKGKSIFVSDASMEIGLCSVINLIGH
jgi:hypothetical protein